MGATTIDHAEYDRRADSARTWQHVSWAFAGVTAVGAAVSAIMWVRASQTYTIDVLPRGNGASISFGGAF